MNCHDKFFEDHLVFTVLVRSRQLIFHFVINFNSHHKYNLKLIIQEQYFYLSYRLSMIYINRLLVLCQKLTSLCLYRHSYWKSVLEKNHIPTSWVLIRHVESSYAIFYLYQWKLTCSHKQFHREIFGFISEIFYLLSNCVWGKHF